MCVSGVPNRNGDKHAREIADLSLKLMENVPQMDIPHLPDERINLRIGAHSGTGWFPEYFYQINTYFTLRSDSSRRSGAGNASLLFVW